jgi:hypothetical protein
MSGKELNYRKEHEILKLLIDYIFIYELKNIIDKIQSKNIFFFNFIFFK